MSVISDVVDVVVSSTQANFTKTGFGLPLIVSHNAAWTERTREYSSLIAVGLDFATTTPEYLAAAILFGAARRPPKILIGRAANKPTMRWAITPTVVNSATYKMKVNGTEVAYTADSSTSASEIALGLKALIDPLALAITVSDQTTFMRVAANVAGAWFNLETSDPKLSLVMDHADPGIAADLAEIYLERSDWYALGTMYNSKAYVSAAAAWANPLKKMYLFQTQDSDVPNVAIGSATDVVTTLKALDYDHVDAIYSKGTGDFADMGWYSRVLPIVPGLETWKFKSLAGVPVGVYTDTQRTNMRAKNCNFYENTLGQPMTEEGYSVGGDWMDVIRYVDYLIQQIQLAELEPLAEEDKISFNDEGFLRMENLVGGVLESEERRKVINPGWSTSVPKLADISSSDRTARYFDGVNFSAVYSGAIHKVKINGVLTQ